MSRAFQTLSLAKLTSESNDAAIEKAKAFAAAHGVKAAAYKVDGKTNNRTFTES